MTKLQQIMLSAASAFALLSAEPALGDSNTATVQQGSATIPSTDNTANQTQTSTGNTAKAYQYDFVGPSPDAAEDLAHGETAYHDFKGGQLINQYQYGTNGYVKAFQYGQDNTAYQKQTAVSNGESGTIEQYGAYNTVSQLQQGSGDTAFVYQLGYENQITQTQNPGGSNNTASVRQYGFYSVATQTQSGSGNKAYIQQGNRDGHYVRDVDDLFEGDKAYQTQTGTNGPATAHIYQLGNVDLAVQYQQSGRAYITQGYGPAYINGHNNYAHQIQKSTEEPNSDTAGALARITQYGQGNYATQYQTSDSPGDSPPDHRGGPSAVIVQVGGVAGTGGYNIATQRQLDADSSYAKIGQYGYANVAHQLQKDDVHPGNSAKIYQTGGNNYASQYQTGGGGSTTLLAAANVAKITQVGYSDIATQNQYGYGDNAKATQIGTSDFSKQRQYGNYDHGTVTQGGHNNIATQIQH